MNADSFGRIFALCWRYLQGCHDEVPAPYSIGVVDLGKFVPALDYAKDTPLDFNLDLGPVGTLAAD